MSAAPLKAMGLDPACFSVSRPRDFCAVVRPEPSYFEDPEHAPDYLHARVLAGPQREELFAFVDTTGLVIFKDLRSPDSNYRGVRGRSSKGRLSQGEYFHHDGCSGPTKPRVVEIRCPHQKVERWINTAIAPFPDTVRAMFACLPDGLSSDAKLAAWAVRVAEDPACSREDFDLAQGLATRAIRRELDAESARAYFRAVDVACDAYAEPWELGESRWIANANATQTMQHRRSYPRPHTGGAPTGHLLKRWPCEELPEPARGAQAEDPAQASKSGL